MSTDSDPPSIHNVEGASTLARIAELEAELTELRRLPPPSPGQLMKDDRQMEALLHAVPEAVVTVDESQIIQSFSPGAEETFGYAASEVIGKSIEMLLPEGQRSLHRHHVGDFAKGPDLARRMDRRQAIEGRRKDGTTFPAEAAIIRNEQPDGSMLMTAILRDITASVEAARALRESEQRFREIFENAVDVVFVITNGEDHFDSANPAVERLLGYSQAELLSLPLTNYIAPESWAAMGERREILQSGGTVPAQEFTMLRKDGRRVQVQLSTVSVFRDGKPYSVLGIGRDLTDRRALEAIASEAQERVREREARLELLFERAIDPVVLVDPTKELIIIDCNETAENFFQKSGESLIGTSYHDLLVDDQDLPDELQPRTIPMGEVFNRVRRVRRSDGAIATVEARGTRLTEDYSILILRDITATNAAEAAAERANAQFRAVVEQAMDGIAIIQDGVLSFANPAALEIIGYTPETGTRWLDLVAPEEHARVLEYEQLRLSDGQVPDEYELLLLTKSGKRALVELRPRIIEFDERPATLLVLRDVTEQRALEAAAREAEERSKALEAKQRSTEAVVTERESRLEVLFKESMDPILVLDPSDDLRILDFNKMAENFFDVPGEDLAGMSYVDLMVSESDPWTKIRENWVSSGVLVNRLRQFRRRDGEVATMEVRAKQVREDFSIVVMRDVTARQKAEIQLQQSEQRLRSLVQQMPVAIFEFDRDGIVVSGDGDVDRPELPFKVGVSVWDIWKDNPDCLTLLAEVYSGHEASKLLSAGGRSFQTVCTPRLDSEGTVEGFVSIFVDVTEQQQLEQQVSRSQRLDAIGQLAAGVAHDFNNFLTVINGNSEFALQVLDEEHSAYPAILDVLDAGNRSARVVRQLLAFSRQDPGSPEDVQVNDIIQELEPMLTPLLGVNIVLSLSLADGLPAVRVDASKLGQVVMNLAINARDAMPSGGRLVMSTSVVSDGAGGGESVLFLVQDFGIGMSEAVLERLFEPFFSTKEPGAGTGLGLSMVHGIITQYGGTIQVESELGKGSTFKVKLPAVRADSE